MRHCTFLWILAGFATAAVAGEPSPRVELRGAAQALGSSLDLSAVPGGLIGGAGSYEARFDAAGVTFVPALGPCAPFDHTLSLEAFAIERGPASLALEPVAPRAEGLTAVYARAPGIAERYEVTPAGLAQTFVLAEPFGTRGDLVVRLRLGGAAAGLAERQGDGSHRFAGEHGGVSFGTLTGIDADGRSAPGAVRAAGGMLELVLPASFVDGARWPLVLDPLIGTVLTVEGSSYDDARADAAFEELSQRWLVVWRRSFSAASALVRGRLLNAEGVPVLGTLFFSSTGFAGRPRVATVQQSGRFIVAWDQEEPGLLSQVLAMPCDPLTGTLYEYEYLDTGAPGSLRHADIGADRADTGAEAVVVWDDDASGLQGARLGLGTSGSSVLLEQFALALDSAPFVTHARPSISRSPSAQGVYAVAYTSGFLDQDPRVLALDRDGDVLGTALLFDTPQHELEVDVDGGGDGAGEWVAAAASSFSGSDTLRGSAVRWTGTAFSVQPPVVITSLLAGPEHFGVGLRPGKAYVTWQQDGSTWDALYLRGINTATCATCEGSLFLGSVLAGGQAFPSVALASSSGGGDGVLGLALWNRPVPGPLLTHNDVLAQRLAVLGTSGSFQDLGGGCGPGGHIDLAQAGEPAIGNGLFRPALAGADPLATLAVLNVTVPQPPLACGPCALAPYLMTITLPMAGGAASALVPIPCSPSYVGAELDLQYTVTSPASSPCPSSPGHAYSNIVRVTLGS